MACIRASSACTEQKQGGVGSGPNDTGLLQSEESNALRLDLCTGIQDMGGTCMSESAHIMNAGSTFNTAWLAACRPSRKGSPAAFTASLAVEGTRMYAAYTHEVRRCVQMPIVCRQYADISIVIGQPQSLKPATFESIRDTSPGLSGDLMPPFDTPNKAKLT